MNRKLFLLLCSIFCTVVLCAACHRYRSQVTPLKLPSAYSNSVTIADAAIAAKAYTDNEEAKKAFGFDVRGAGLMPVQIVFDNQGKHSFEILSGQTFLIDKADNLWPIVDSGLAYDRIAKRTELGNIAPEAVKHGTLGGIAGAMIGAAIGIVSGQNVGQAAAAGAALGAATGATVGGIKGATDTGPQRMIGEDLQKRSLENKPIQPREIAYGFLFFPGEAGQPKQLRLKLKEKDTGAIHLLQFSL